ncbi:MAG: DUF2341 domain-containing protein [Gammaproteobacteria bacterium]|nr:DUF2341 domain-containing protein [Gammaproteobacteria bacterium]
MPLPTINGEQFGYYDILTLNAASVALTDFQVKKTINWVPHMQSDFADMLFTTFGGTVIPYWIESKTDSVTADIWLKIPAISAVYNTRVLMYYGNPSVSSASNADDTFIQYHGVATATYHDSNVLDSATTNFVWESYAKNIDASKLIRHGVGNQASFTGQDCFSIYRDGNGAIGYLVIRDEGSATLVSESMTISTNVYYDWKITWDGTTARGYVDGNEINTGVTSGFPDELMGLFMSESEVDEGNGQQDWSRIRKYAATEPTWAADSGEQHQRVVPQFM